MSPKAKVQQAIDMSKIHTRAMLCALRISTWTARKFDKKVTAEIAQKHGAAADAGRYNKMLVPSDLASYKQLIQDFTDARTFHYAHTLPWTDEGWRLVTTAEYTRYADGLRQRRDRITSTSLPAFLTDYPTVRAMAPSRLNGMYDAADFPATDDVRKRFAFSVEYKPLPTAGDFRVDLAPDVVKMLERASADHVTAAVQAAMADAWRQLHDVVSKVADRLSSADNIFRDSLIGNIRETCDILRTLNVTGDADLERLRADVDRRLGTYDADTLRKDDRARKDVKAAADDIVARMSAYLPTPTSATGGAL